MEVECILDEWQTDKHTDIQFSAAAYHDKYSARLKTLNDFNEHTKEANNVPHLFERLPKSAWCVTPISRSEHASFLMHANGREALAAAT
jgi:hypothetical protein